MGEGAAIESPIAEPRPIKTIEEWRIPRWLLGDAQAGAVLDLLPTEDGYPPVRFSARAQFRIGRSRDMSDFPVRFASLPDVGENVRELSRVHVLMELCPNGLTFRDGNGEKRSTNGSAYGNEPLDPKRPFFLHGRDVLVLSEEYRLEVVPVLRRQGLMFEPVNFDEWKGATMPFDFQSAIAGAVYFLTLDNHPMIRDAVWLLSDMGFCLSSEGRFAWVDTDDSATGWMLYRSGTFWLANVSLEEGQARIDDSVLEVGQIAPLIDGQRLEIGSCEFKAKLY